MGTTFDGPNDVGKAKGIAPPAPSRRRGLRLRDLMIVTVVAAVSLTVAGCLGLGIIVGLLLAFALVSAPIVVFVKLRTTRQEGLLRLLAAAAEHRVPPGPAVEAFGDLCGLGYRRKLRALAILLDAGMALPEALGRSPGIVSAGALVLIRVGWEAGDPAGALRDAAEAAGGPWHSHRQGVAKALAYGLGMLLVLQVLGGFMFYYIAPMYYRILRDFGEPLPPLTRMVFEGTNALTRHWPIVLAVSLLELAGASLLGAMLISYIFGFDLRLPLVDRLARRGHAAAILKMLAMVVEGRRPMVSGLALIADDYPREWVRLRLRRAERRAREGESWSLALRDEGLIRASDASVLDAAQRAGNLPWALRELAEGAERRSAYRLRALGQTLMPLVVLAIGTLVALIAVAFFLPLTTLIRDLAG